MDNFKNSVLRSFQTTTPGVLQGMIADPAKNIAGGLGAAYDFANSVLGHGNQQPSYASGVPTPITPSQQQPTPTPNASGITHIGAPHVVTPTPYPGEVEWAQDQHEKTGKSVDELRKLYVQSVQDKNFSGHYYDPQQGVQGAHTSNYQQNITIPGSNGGETRLDPGLAQQIMNAFDDMKQATNAAQVLHHPANNPYLPGDPLSINHDTHGENASFKTNNVDATNPDGSIDRGLFRINDRTFNGMMSNPDSVKKMDKYGIHSWQDMEDPQKNAFMARLIYQNGGWGRWFAAPRELRAEGAPDKEKLQTMIDDYKASHPTQDKSR